jgi:hypothetical protein
MAKTGDHDHSPYPFWFAPSARRRDVSTPGRAVFIDLDYLNAGVPIRDPRFLPTNLARNWHGLRAEVQKLPLTCDFDAHVR